MIKNIAILVTILFVICLCLIIAEIIIKKWFVRAGLDSDLLKTNDLFYKLFFSSKCIGVISFIGMILLWILYFVQLFPRN